MTLGELVRDSGFARSTVIIHLERLGTEGLISSLRVTDLLTFGILSKLVFTVFKGSGLQRKGSAKTGKLSSVVAWRICR